MSKLNSRAVEIRTLEDSSPETWDAEGTRLEESKAKKSCSKSLIFAIRTPKSRDLEDRKQRSRSPGSNLGDSDAVESSLGHLDADE